MKHSDLGQMDGAVLLFGGPYSNHQATQAVIDMAARHGIAKGAMICTGDVVAYCGAPNATTSLIRALHRDGGCAVVAGNCERQLASGASDCGCGFAAGSACDLLSDGWYGFAAAQMEGTACQWMDALPDVVSFRHQGARYAVIHGGMTDIARFIWPTSPDAVFTQEWQAVEAAIGAVDHIIAGHCGIPFIRDTPKGRWINAGVIGMPPHDGRQQTRYGVLDGAEVAIHRLDYNVAGAVADMTVAGLPPAYRDSLRSGYWPSEDVLPPSLRLPFLASG